jgi:gliding motility-associated lipoprotein GldH
MKNASLIFLVLSLPLITACDKYRVYEQYYKFDNKVWVADTTLRFGFEIADTSKLYNILYSVRYTIEYPYYNLYVKYKFKTQSDSVLYADLHEMNLNHPKTGQPLGSGIGSTKSLQIYAFKDFKFKQAGKYIFEVLQYMRQDSLPDILDFGLRVEIAK